MSEVWIQEEQLNAEFYEMVGHYVQLEGTIESVYFISERISLSINYAQT
ncbi:hypothetical protein M3592_24630 [Priestia aryabhattai]|nr:hypothetical protein [Priestia aryabhattai]MCM2978644.1 hypothetical protein [Priestia aryabhattai]